jgi:hypothetical protein
VQGISPVRGAHAVASGHTGGGPCGPPPQPLPLEGPRGGRETSFLRAVWWPGNSLPLGGEGWGGGAAQPSALSSVGPDCNGSFWEDTENTEVHGEPGGCGQAGWLSAISSVYLRVLCVSVVKRALQWHPPILKAKALVIGTARRHRPADCRCPAGRAASKLVNGAPRSRKRLRSL